MCHWWPASRCILLLVIATAVAGVSGCGDDTTAVTTPVAGGGGGGSPDPGPPPVGTDPGPPPVDTEPGPPPVGTDPGPPPVDTEPGPPPLVDDPGPPPVTPAPSPPAPTAVPKVAPKPAIVAPPPGEAIEVVTRQGRKRANVAAGVVLDTTLLSTLADAGGLHEIDVTATEAPLLKVVTVIRRFPQLRVDFRAGSWMPGEVTLNEYATADDLRAVASMREVRRLDVSECRLGDAELAELGRMAGLEALDLPPTTSDAIAPTLVRMRSLKELSLEATQVTGAGLAALPRSLESLNLSSTSIDDAAVEHLRRLPGLKQLWLDETSVGDKSLSVVSTRTRMARTVRIGLTRRV